MQEMQQMMQHMQSSQKNQTAKQDTTGAGKKGRGDGQGVTGPGSAARQPAQRPPDAGSPTGAQRLQYQEPAPERGPLLADDEGSSDDSGSTPSEPIETSGDDRKPSDHFATSLRDLRAEVPTAEPAASTPARGPASTSVAGDAAPAVYRRGCKRNASK